MAKDSLKDKFGFTKAQLDTLIITLNELINRALANDIPVRSDGICENWNRVIRAVDPRLVHITDAQHTAGIKGAWTAYRLVCLLSADWPKSLHFGEPSLYPIHYSYGKWEDDGLVARLSLMRYMAHRLRDWRRRTKA